MTDLIPYAPRLPRADRLQETAELANTVAGTDFVPEAIRNNPAAITAVILYGDEVGLGPMESLQKVITIKGRPGLMAEAQRALILQAGHELWIEESTITKCTIAGRRRGSDKITRVTWTMDDAKRARLDGNPAYRAYPRAMLLARASAELARAVFADAIGGLMAAEELDDDVTLLDGGAPAATPAPKTTKRKRALTAPAPATTPEAPPPSPVELPPLPGEDEPAMILKPQRDALHARFREKGITDRRQRLDYCSLVTGRKIDSANDLTMEEATEVLTQLHQLDPGDRSTWPSASGEQTDIPF